MKKFIQTPLYEEIKQKAEQNIELGGLNFGVVFLFYYHCIVYYWYILAIFVFPKQWANYDTYIMYNKCAYKKNNVI